MKKFPIVQTHTNHRLTARFAVIFLFAAILSTLPFYSALAQTAPDLGAVGSFAVLAGTAVSCTDSTIVGDVGVSPGSVVTNVRCTIIGTVHTNDTAASNAQAALLAAYNSLVDQTCTQTLSSTLVPTPSPLAPGVYCFDAPGVAFTDKTLTLDGSTNPNGIWIFQVGAALAGSGFQVVLTNGAQPCNVFWAVGADATLTTSTLPPLFLGSILAGAQTAAGGSITITGGSVVGHVLANTAVSMTGTSVVGCGSFVPPIPPDFCKDCKDCKDHDEDNDKDKDHDKDNDKDKDHDKDNDKDKDHDKDNDKDKDHDKDHHGR